MDGSFITVSPAPSWSSAAVCPLLAQTERWLTSRRWTGHTPPWSPVCSSASRCDRCFHSAWNRSATGRWPCYRLQREGGTRWEIRKRCRSVLTWRISVHVLWLPDFSFKARSVFNISMYFKGYKVPKTLRGDTGPQHYRTFTVQNSLPRVLIHTFWWSFITRKLNTINVYVYFCDGRTKEVTSWHIFQITRWFKDIA